MVRIVKLEAMNKNLERTSKKERKKLKGEKGNPTVRATKLSDGVDESVMEVSSPTETRLRIGSQDEVRLSYTFAIEIIKHFFL